MMRQYIGTRLIEYFYHVELSHKNHHWLTTTASSLAGYGMGNTVEEVLGQNLSLKVAGEEMDQYIGVAFLSNTVNHQKSTSLYM
jgi:hypothetical protein